MKRMKMPSVMRGGHQFSQVPKAKIERSQFDRSHALKTTFNAGYIVPVYVDEALPGDTFHMRMTAFARLATPLKPLMDNMYLDVFFFAVPYRLVWTNWQKFNGEQEDPGDSTSYVIPYTTVPAAGYTSGKLEDYLGLPVDVAVGSPGWTHSALFTRAYYRIYNEWFRDQNLIDTVNQVGSSASPNYGDGPDAPGTGGSPLMKRGKRHDYFTSCLPWPQKGTAVSIPLGTTAPVVRSGNAIPQFENVSATVSAGILRATSSADVSPVEVTSPVGNWTAGESLVWQDPKLAVDLSSATAATINTLRQAFQVQKLLERDARGGTRYTEIVKAHFGVTSPDARLQRAEYLGGGTVPVVINPISQATDVQRTDAGVAIAGSTPQGNLSGVGTAAASGIGFVKSFTEHCILLGLVSVRADLTYQEGIDRMFSRSTRYDFFWPALAHIGEQAVLNKEIFADGSSNDDDVFGYQERYAEYRYKQSKITGKFRSIVSDTLDIWHLSQEFGSLPTLNQTFIEETPPMDRVLATPDEPDFLFDSFFSLKCARPMPMYGVPGLIDHF